jgi:glycine/D-amino acid oxidase-like deaminating enzyme
MTKHGVSPWLDQYPKSRIPSYPKQRGPLQTGVVVVGGGLTGCLTAYALAAAGEKVTLLEANRIGRGSTASSSGWISEEPGVAFNDVEKAIGLRQARHAWQSWRRAALDFSALVRRLRISCHLEPRDLVTVAVTPDQIGRLKKDRKARVEAGLGASLLNMRAIKSMLAIEAAAGLRAKDGATLDPYRACVGIVGAAVDRGAAVHEQSAVRRITFTRRIANVFTADGAIRTRRVVIATGTPVAISRSLARHFWFHTRYFAMTEPVPAKIRGQLGARKSIVRDLAVPPHVLRWVDDARLLVGGADSALIPERQRQKTIVQRTARLMYELSTIYPEISGLQPAYGWTADYCRTGDGLPYIGPHRNFPHHLFAFGNSGHDITAAYLASRMLLRYCLDETLPADAAFGFNR